MNTIHIPQRCGARVHQRVITDADDRVLRSSPYCHRWAVPGRARCKLHGGLTLTGEDGHVGPKTAEGKARSLVARVEGRRRWLAELKAKGLPISFGRKSKHIKREAERVATLAPIDRQREEALAAIAQMKANLRANMEAHNG